VIEMNQIIKQKLKILPEKPGCYLMKDSSGTIIYVGKAKVLRNRVYSYFVGSHNEKTESLLNEIEDFDYIVTSNNSEALILEMNLIKKNLPKYNIMLKDDKSYPYIKISDERHPQLIITREVKQDKGKYFGPYPNVQAANETKKLLEHLFPLRRCPLSRKRPCLYYQLGQCIGPCAREVSTAEYKKAIDGITRFFNGGYREIKKQLKEEMQLASESLDFEKAKEVQHKIVQIEIIMEQQKMLFPDKLNRDVIGYDVKEGWACVQVFFVRQGKMMGRDKLLFPYAGDVEATLLLVLKTFYQRNSMPKEIICPMSISEGLETLFPSVKIIVPKRGQKKELVRLATENASAALTEKFYLESV
jgi:excinuclease ABC subunit C